TRTVSWPSSIGTSGAGSPTPWAAVMSPSARLSWQMTFLSDHAFCQVRCQFVFGDRAKGLGPLTPDPFFGPARNATRCPPLGRGGLERLNELRSPCSQVAPDEVSGPDRPGACR